MRRPRLPPSSGSIAAGSAQGITVLEQTQAGKQAFLAEARRHRWLHAATHGFFVEDQLPSPAASSPPEKDRFGEMLLRPELAGLYPGLLSGLALAGANRSDKAGTFLDPDADNGILTAEEIGAQNLDGVELVVLSACETGLGQAAGGEGLLSLQRAFQSAGAADCGGQSVERARRGNPVAHGSLLRKPVAETNGAASGLCAKPSYGSSAAVRSAASPKAMRNQRCRRSVALRSTGLPSCSAATGGRRGIEPCDLSSDCRHSCC